MPLAELIQRLQTLLEKDPDAKAMVYIDDVGSQEISCVELLKDTVYIGDK